MGTNIIPIIKLVITIHMLRYVALIIAGIPTSYLHIKRKIEQYPYSLYVKVKSYA